MNRVVLLFLLLMLCGLQVMARQDYIDRKYEKGYAKDGMKIGFWEYYRSDEELEIKYSHTSGKVVYMRPDTSEFVIFKNNQWVSQRLQVYPIFIGSTVYYYKDLAMELDYPAKARDRNFQGTIYISFEIDTLGYPQNVRLVNELCRKCHDKTLKIVKEKLGHWVSAREGGQRYRSRFIQPVIYSLYNVKDQSGQEIELPKAKILPAVEIVARGG